MSFTASDETPDNRWLIGGATAVFLLCVLWDLRGGALAGLLAPVFGEPDAGGWGARIGLALFVTIIFIANAFVIRNAPKDLRLYIVWFDLLVLILLFFWSFNLSYGYIAEKLPFMITQGLFTTLYISIISILFACLLALVAAVAKLSSNPVAYGISTFYISFFRGLPLLVQLFLIYNGLIQIGINVSAVPAGIIALSLCYGAYMAEIFRAGILGVPKGQSEGGRALGLSENMIFTKIVFPQAMRLIVPPTGNQFIAMVKDSSLVSVIGVWELTKVAGIFGKQAFKNIEMFVAAGIIYWLVSIVLELCQSKLEAHYAKGVNAR